MSAAEIPLLRESAAYVSRLMEGARSYAQPAYAFHRRVNWSYRHGQAFYAREARLFSAAPEDYFDGRVSEAPVLEDVFAQRLRWKQSLVVLAKVAAHGLFRVLGGLGSLGGRAVRVDGIGTYRKGYVDDIELVFDVDEPGVVRAIYPFPISVRRQLRYLGYLKRSGFRFKLAGNAYVAADVWRFILHRNVRTLARLESRAQVRHAREVAALGVHTVQLSDEFDIGSLDFARTLARHSLRVVNSAHGVGKYLPMHAYQAFDVLTLKQQQYYHAVRPCVYRLRQLNVQTQAAAAPEAMPLPGPCGIDVVVLSQSFGGAPGLIEDSETQLVAGLARELAGLAGVRLHYKPHPNRHAPTTPRGFEMLKDLKVVNGRPGTVFLSFFSTCQIDPAFQGRKILVRARLIHPEISFDDSEEIVDIDRVGGMLRALAQVPDSTSIAA